MILDETFVWLYAAFKVGRACFVLAGAGFASAVISFGLACETRGSFMPALICAVFCAACLFLAVATPSFDEVKAYAFYRIGCDGVDSDAAQKLFDASLKVLEGKGE